MCIVPNPDQAKLAQPALEVHLSGVVLTQDVAPLVLYSQRDQVFSQVSGQSPWQHALPGLAKEDGLGLSGFRSPSMCKEVFQFEAQDTTAVQATQHVQRFLTGGSSMRGSGSIALPPVTPIQVCVHQCVRAFFGTYATQLGKIAAAWMS